MSLTSEERTLADELGFDHDVCVLLKGQRQLRRVLGINSQGELEPQAGVSVAVEDGDAAEKVITAIQSELLARGYRAFWSQRRMPNGITESDEVVVLKTTDSYAIVHLMRTDGANHGISTDDILDRLRGWEGICRFDVVGASTDWVALQFHTLPENICAFAEDVYVFCPDAVEQGVGLKREADDPELFAEARRLCPELSPDFARRLKGQLDTFGNTMAQLPEELRDKMQELMQYVQATSTSSEMGVRLLAREIRRTKYVFLWWD